MDFSKEQWVYIHIFAPKNKGVSISPQWVPRTMIEVHNISYADGICSKTKSFRWAFVVLLIRGLRLDVF
jgi:hypothetical protein